MSVDSLLFFLMKKCLVPFMAELLQSFDFLVH